MGLEEYRHDFWDIYEILKKLRGENGCPWDKKQTVETMTVCIEEEFYELLDALDRMEPENVEEELGDVLFLLVFIANLFEEKNMFSMRDVVERNAEKLIRRHPHVFGDEIALTESEVLKRWEKIKKEEKKNLKNSVLDSVPAKMPPLKKAYSISDRAARNGFDWDDIDGVLEKVDEELAELRDAIKNKGKNEVEMEFGDLLFTLTNVARHAKIHPDTALKKSIKKFELRFRDMESAFINEDKELNSVPREEIDNLWGKVKEVYK